MSNGSNVTARLVLTMADGATWDMDLELQEFQIDTITTPMDQMYPHLVNVTERTVTLKARLAPRGILHTPPDPLPTLRIDPS